MMLDASKSGDQRRLLEIELEAVGIRINRAKPNIYFKVKKVSSFLSVPVFTSKGGYAVVVCLIISSSKVAYRSLPPPSLIISMSG